MLDSLLEPPARRLALAAALSGHMRRLVGQRIPASTTEADLVDIALRLGAAAHAFERTYCLRFEPAFPGATIGPQLAGIHLRLVLACAAFHADTTPVGVVFTTLITGRFVQVAVAPSHTPIPQHWRPL